MIGDFNADPTSLAGGMLNLFCNTNNFEQLIGEPKRITEMSRSVLDQVVTNIGHFVKEARVDPPVSSSDHCTVSLDLLFHLKKQKAYTRRVWEFANARFDNYRNSLSTMSLAECIDVNIEESCDRLTKSLLDAAHQCIPSKIVTIHPNDKPWFNNYLRRLLCTKNCAHNTAKKSNNIEDWAIFRRHRNFHNEEVKRIKSEFREKRLKSLAVQGTENPKKVVVYFKKYMEQA